MIAVVVMACILGALVLAFTAFYLHSRTPEWGDSEVRKGLLQMLVVIGPMLGMHYREPHREVPAVMAPGPKGEPGPAGDPDPGAGPGPDSGAGSGPDSGAGPGPGPGADPGPAPDPAIRRS